MLSRNPFCVGQTYSRCDKVITKLWSDRMAQGQNDTIVLSHKNNNKGVVHIKRILQLCTSLPASLWPLRSQTLHSCHPPCPGRCSTDPRLRCGVIKTYSTGREIERPHPWFGPSQIFIYSRDLIAHLMRQERPTPKHSTNKSAENKLSQPTKHDRPWKI